MRIFLILMFFIPVSVLAQSYSLEIKDKETGKITYIKENKRIKVKTITGLKLQGRVTFTDSVSLIVKGVNIPLEEINFIQKRPLGITLTEVGLISIGGIGIGISAIVLLADTTGAIALFSTGTGLLASGLVLPHFSKKYKSENYIFRIVFVD